MLKVLWRLVASFELVDYNGNHYTLDVRNADGELTYSLYGATSYVPFSLSNLQLRKPLPRLINPDFIRDVKSALNTAPGYTLQEA